MKSWKSAAARRLLKSTGSPSVRAAVEALAGDLLGPAETPPTDLDRLAARFRTTIVPGDIFGSGELRRTTDGYEIVYAKDLTLSRRRFTIAHEIAHIAIIQTGPGAPTSGREVERICDLIAVELLMPRSVFDMHTPSEPSIVDVFALAKRFQTSLVATGQRCTEIRSVTFLELEKGKILRSIGSLSRSSALRDPILLEHLAAVGGGQSEDVAMYLNHNGSIIAVRVECRPLGHSGRAICLLRRISIAEARRRIEDKEAIPVEGWQNLG